MSATPLESLDEHSEEDDESNNDGDNDYNDKGDDNFNNEYEHNVDLDENEDDQTDQDNVNHGNTEFRDLTDNKKPYYLAKIYPIICYLCGSPSVSNEKVTSRNMRPVCNKCVGMDDSKKCYGQKPARESNAKKSCT
ncbi:6943_t:CDS:2 [Cetraspora pellucida]|uniref:6943_t:CDS:1 n=1 Tax=Cetraspora pellucida TaxID=1433469 RepID=A0A9N9JBF5_9GLOM|nr:6943_t:CDS:2 [Cetraspora pellucida]